MGSGPGAKDDAIDDVDMERAGLAGRTGPGAGAKDDGDAGKALLLTPPLLESLFEEVEDCLACVGMVAWVGVGVGVDWVDGVVVVLTLVGCCFWGAGPGWTWPSSPAANVKQEQKPSEEVMRRVRPSLDL